MSTVERIRYCSLGIMDWCDWWFYVKHKILVPENIARLFST
jgi:hypothetical protein